MKINLKISEHAREHVDEFDDEARIGRRRGNAGRAIEETIENNQALPKE